MFDASAPRPQCVPVWDLPLRLFHWSLLLGVATAAVTGFLLDATWLNLHLIGGTAIIVLLAFRLVWGFTGTSFSRFKSFLFSPRQTIAHFKGVIAGDAPHHDGHNPVGAAMIFALLGSLAALTITGVVVLGGAEKQGPLKAFVSFATASLTRQIHELFAYGLLALIVGHVAGVILESRRSGVNLARSMVTGKKPSLQIIPLAPPRIGRFFASAIAMTIILGGGAYAMWRQPASGVPQAALDETYAKNCGDCHIPFHPSLRGKAAWGQIMANLSGHFGEDASLDDATTAQLAAYLGNNAAEAWDTRAANVFRGPEPLAMTETAFWKRRHAGIDAAVFKRQKVETKSNCEACHGDARQGLFMPQAIDIPKE